LPPTKPPIVPTALGVRWLRRRAAIKMLRMATSIVIELQQLADNGQTPITDVLRKALIVATKLKIDDFKEWVENELGGYDGKTLPPYRIIYGDLKANDRNGAWIPARAPTNELMNTFSRVYM
jgi:hypothetical protein